MSNLFDPEIGVVNSSVTPSQPVNTSGNVQLFADVLNVATEASFAYAGGKELDNLKKKFGNIAQARAQGGKSSALQAKARAALDEAKANSPWIASKADSLFQSTFGGGGSSGTFSKTPQEKAEEAYQADVAEKSLRLGVPMEEAAKRISMEENASSAKALADSQKDVREYNGELVFANTQVQINNNTVKLMDAAKRAMTNGGGTLSLDDKRSLDFTIDATVAQLKGELASQVRDPNTGHLLIGKDEYDESLAEIEDWAKNSKQLVGDSSYLKVIQDVNTASKAEAQVIAAKNYPTLTALNTAGGQALVQTYLQALDMPEGQAKQILISSNPVLKQAFKQQGSFKQAAMTGVDKLIVPSDDAFNMTENEAYATGTVLNDPRNAKLAEGVLDNVASKMGNAFTAFTQMFSKNPDAANMVKTPSYKAWAQANSAKAERVNEGVMGGLKKGFLSTYAGDTGSLPTDFTIGAAPKPTSKLASSKQRAPNPNTISGEGLTKESAIFLRNMLSVYTYNPKELEKARKDSGVPDLTPQEAVPYFVLDKLPERFSNNNSEKSDLQTPAPVTPVDGMTGASTPAGRSLSENQAIGDKQLNDFADLAIERGFTNDDLVVMLDRAGLFEGPNSQEIQDKLIQTVEAKRETNKAAKSTTLNDKDIPKQGGSMSNFVNKAVELNWTEDDIRFFIGDMGLADNAQTEELTNKLINAVNQKRGG